MLSLVTTKYCKRGSLDHKEIAAVKCLIDFRIRFYEMTGSDSDCKKYVQGAIDLHKCLTKESVPAMNRVIEEWTAQKKLDFLIICESRKRYLDHYKALLRKQQKPPQSRVTTLF